MKLVASYLFYNPRVLPHVLTCCFHNSVAVFLIGILFFCGWCIYRFFKKKRTKPQQQQKKKAEEVSYSDPNILHVDRRETLLSPFDCYTQT